MAAGKPVVIAFDAYGTLLSTASISNQLTTYYGEERAELIAAQWRRYQLEYTWRLNSMGNFIRIENTDVHLD
jgi:2-haloacid dehalogenase